MAENKEYLLRVFDPAYKTLLCSRAVQAKLMALLGGEQEVLVHEGKHTPRPSSLLHQQRSTKSRQPVIPNSSSTSCTETSTLYSMQHIGIWCTQALACTLVIRLDALILTTLLRR